MSPCIRNTKLNTVNTIITEKSHFHLLPFVFSIILLHSLLAVDCYCICAYLAHALNKNLNIYELIQGEKQQQQQQKRISSFF